MKTAWSETLDPNAILPEYPRPQMVRESYLNLNGVLQRKGKRRKSQRGVSLCRFRRKASFPV